MPTIFMSVVCATLLVLFSAVNCLAGSVTLSWGNNDDADYYIVYYGAESNRYTNQTEQINSPLTSATIDVDEGTWYFSVKAFNTCGNSSDYSDEVHTVVIDEVEEVLDKVVFISAVMSGAIRVTVEQMTASGKWVPLSYSVQQPEVDEELNTPYKGNSNSKVFHKIGCRYYDSATVPFNTTETALYNSYTPCQVCKPLEE